MARVWTHAATSVEPLLVAGLWTFGWLKSPTSLLTEYGRARAVLGLVALVAFGLEYSRWPRQWAVRAGYRHESGGSEAVAMGVVLAPMAVLAYTDCAQTAQAALACALAATTAQAQPLVWALARSIVATVCAWKCGALAGDRLVVGLGAVALERALVWSLRENFSRGEAPLVAALIALGGDVVWRTGVERAVSADGAGLEARASLELALGALVGAACVRLARLARVPAAVSLGFGVAAGSATAYVRLWHLARREPLLWLVDLELLGEPRHCALLVAWLALLLLFLSTPALTHPATGTADAAASLLVRKHYHGLVVAMFVPGVLVAPAFCVLAMGAAFVVFVGAELTRALGVGPVAARLGAFMAPLVDARDRGPAVLTHVYLLVGCALPLGMALSAGPSGSGSAVVRTWLGRVEALAGVLALGVGDALASWGGLRFGRRRWAGTRKSIEGTAIGAAGTLVAAALLAIGTDGPASASEAVCVAAAIVAALVLEAVTPLIDNLVLPIFLGAALHQIRIGG